MTWVLEHSPATGNDRLALIAIADEADDDGRNAFPGLPRISHKSRVPVRTVIRCLDRLERGGQLLVRRPDVRGRGHHNRYIVVMGRDPLALAGENGWPPPNLDPDVEWCHPDTDSDPAPPVDNPVDNRGGPVDNRRERPRKRVTDPPENVTPDGTRPFYPDNPKAPGVAVRPQVDDDAELDPIPAGATGPAIVDDIRARHRLYPVPPPDDDDDDPDDTAADPDEVTA